jgi:quercetin dioxygenase-like cupin family protein
MDAPNLFDPVWDFEGSRDDGATTRAVRLGAQAGAERLGASLYELESGAMASPLHFHHGAEEILFVIAGEPTLRTGTGEDDERTLTTGEVVSFPAATAPTRSSTAPPRPPASSSARPTTCPRSPSRSRPV